MKLFKIIKKIQQFPQRWHSLRYQRCIASYQANAPKVLIDSLHYKILRYARHYAARGRDDLLNQIFFTSYFVKAQKEPNEEAYNKWIHGFSQLSFKTGERLREPLQTWYHDKPRLAFLGLGDDPSAYEHIYQLCEHLQKTGSYTPHLFLFSWHDNLDLIRTRFAEVGTPVTIVSFNEVMASSLRMRQALVKEQIDIAVWVHLPTLIFPLFGMRIAAKQIFLSQYLHPDLSQFNIDGLITYGSIGEKDTVFLNDFWRVIPSALHITIKNYRDSQNLRARYAKEENFILATFGRIDKIRQKKFLYSIVEVLQAMPNTIYLYTGYEDDPQITAFFTERGLAHRITFIGWVDIDDYIQIVDLVLDSFPIATGITALKAMAYGKPVLSMGNKYSYMGRDIKPIAEHLTFTGFRQAEVTFNELKAVILSLASAPYASDEKDYARKAVELIDDENKRQNLARFQHLCFERLYSNTDLMGSIFVEHLRSIEPQIEVQPE